MVKLAQTVGASNIAASMRQPLHMLGAVMDVRQNIWSDSVEKDAVRVFPFSDITYMGAEAVKSNSVLASCMVPAIASVDASPVSKEKDKAMMFGAPPRHNISSLKDWPRGDNARVPMMLHRSVMTDYILGIGEGLSYRTLTAEDQDLRFKALSDPNSTPEGLDGTLGVTIINYPSEDEALDDITKNPSKMIVGYVVGPRDVKLYYTETAIGMMARRMRNVVQALGPYRPRLQPFGLGHVEFKDGKPVKGPLERKTDYKVCQPGLSWNAGAVAYKAKTINASGTLYIAGDQIPYSTMRRSFKYNHILTQIGMELLDTLSAIGIDLDDELKHAASGISTNGAGVQESALQILYASMFGASSSYSAGQGDFEVSEDVVASRIKDYLTTFFCSGHIHVDPAVFSFRGDSEPSDAAGLFSTGEKFNVRGKQVSAALAYAEFVRSYIVWGVACAALGDYMSVPLLQCHWLYTDKMKPEYVMEQLQMNFRSDVYFDGDSGLPMTLIPSRLNPGEILHRVPCYLSPDKDYPNRYLGIRDPLPFGPVDEIRFAGDRPLTTIEERDYTFSPVIEADASVQSTYRNGRTVNFAVWPRPTHYVPGATRLGFIYGLMADNRKVGGHYYYVPGNSIFEHPTSGQKIYRAMKWSNTDTGAKPEYLLAGQTEAINKKHIEYFEEKAIEPQNNPQLIEPINSARRNEILAKSVKAGADSVAIAEKFGDKVD